MNVIQQVPVGAACAANVSMTVKIDVVVVVMTMNRIGISVVVEIGDERVDLLMQCGREWESVEKDKISKKREAKTKTLGGNAVEMYKEIWWLGRGMKVVE